MACIQRSRTEGSVRSAGGAGERLPGRFVDVRLVGALCELFLGGSLDERTAVLLLHLLVEGLWVSVLPAGHIGDGTLAELLREGLSRVVVRHESAIVGLLVRVLRKLAQTSCMRRIDVPRTIAAGRRLRLSARLRLLDRRLLGGRLLRRGLRGGTGF